MALVRDLVVPVWAIMSVSCAFSTTLSTLPTRRVPGAHAMNLLHYAVPPPEPPTDPFIRGVGESAWCVPNGLEQYSGLALAGRLANVAYYAGWVSALRPSRCCSLLTPTDAGTAIRRIG